MSEIKENSGYSVEDFKTYAEDKPEESKALLRDHLKFTEDGIKLFLADPEKGKLTADFFSELIGEKFDAENGGHHTKVLEAAYGEKMAECMTFTYNNFGEEEEEKTSTEKKPSEGKSKTVTAKPGKKVKAPKAKVDWASLPIPFKEGGKQYIAFDLMIKNSTPKDGEYELNCTPAELIGKIEESLVASGTFDKAKISGARAFSGLKVDMKLPARGWYCEYRDKKFYFGKVADRKTA